MRNIASIEAPSILGLRPGGVEKLPEALKAHGLLNRIPVVYREKIISPSYNPQRMRKQISSIPKQSEIFQSSLPMQFKNSTNKKGFRWFSVEIVALSSVAF